MDLTDIQYFFSFHFWLEFCQWEFQNKTFLISLIENGHRTSAPIWCAPSRHYDRQTNQPTDQPTNGHERSMSGPRGARGRQDKMYTMFEKSFFLIYFLWRDDIIRWLFNPLGTLGYKVGMVFLYALWNPPRHIYFCFCVYVREREKERWRARRERKGFENKVLCQRYHSCTRKRCHYALWLSLFLMSSNIHEPLL